MARATRHDAGAGYLRLGEKEILVRGRLEDPRGVRGFTPTKVLGYSVLGPPLTSEVPHLTPLLDFTQE